MWDAYFHSTEPDGYVKGQHMDMELVVPFAQTAEDGAWQESELEAVKEYILGQF